MKKIIYDGFEDERVTSKVYVEVSDKRCPINNLPYIAIGSTHDEKQRNEHKFMGHLAKGTLPPYDKEVVLKTILTCKNREQAYLFEQYARYKYVCRRADEQDLLVPTLKEIDSFISKAICPELTTTRFDKKRLLLQRKEEDLEEEYRLYCQEQDRARKMAI